MESVLPVLAALGASCALCMPAVGAACSCQAMHFARIPHRWSHLHQVYSAGAYQGEWRRAILRAKEQPRSALIDALFQAMAASNLARILPIQGAQLGRFSLPLLCTPPPSWRRRWQAWHLADQCARWGALRGHWRSSSLLRRQHATVPQASQSGVQRRQNLVGAFAARKLRWQACAPAAVWVFDDVLTTGSTLRECARALRAAGVQEVNALLLSHVPDACSASSP